MTVERTKENLKLCQCMHCPSYTAICKIKSMPKDVWHILGGIDKQEHLEGLFCNFEKRECITEDKGCLCQTCLITQKYHLRHKGFCFVTGGIFICGES